MCNLVLSPLNGLEWFNEIKYNKPLYKFMHKFGELHMRNTSMAAYLSARDDNIIHRHTKTEVRLRPGSASPKRDENQTEVKKPEALLSVLEPKVENKSKGFIFSSVEPDTQKVTEIPQKYLPTQTGALFMRMDANRIRTDAIAATGDPLGRKVPASPHFGNPAVASKLLKAESPQRTDLNFNFLREHNLNEYFRLADPEHRELPQAQQSDEILKDIKAPNPEDDEF